MRSVAVGVDCWYELKVLRIQADSVVVVGLNGVGCDLIRGWGAEFGKVKEGLVGCLMFDDQF